MLMYILWFIFDFCVLVGLICHFIDKHNKQEAENLKKLKRQEKVKKVCNRLSKTLNRLDDFLYTWEKLKEEEK